MFNIGPTELIVILLLALIVFGPKRLPEVGRTVGKSLREFRRASSDIRDELERGLNDDEIHPSATSSSPAAPASPASPVSQAPAPPVTPPEP